jgi:hypothetical protein
VLEGIFIDSGPSYLVKMNFSALTIWAGAFQQAVLAGISAAARTVVAGCTSQKLLPAPSAETLVGLADAFTTVNADRRPKKLVQTLQDKNAGLSQFRSVHADNYKHGQFLFQIKQPVARV